MQRRRYFRPLYLVGDVETEGLSHCNRLIAEALSGSKIPSRLDNLAPAVPIETGPGFLNILEGSVHGEPLLDGGLVRPHVSWCKAAVTPITNTSKDSIHLLIVPSKKSFSY